MSTEATQGRLFDPTRYSPVSIAILQRLPESNARAFQIASALGSFRDAGGSSDRVRSGRQVTGVLVTPRRLPAVLQAIGISSRQWRRYVKEWIQLYVAHRCETGSMFLFARPEFAECPSCHARLEIDHVPEMWRRKRNERDTHGRFTAKVTAVSRPIGGRSTATDADGVRPQSERESAPPKDEFLQGLEVGVPLEPEEEEPFALAKKLSEGPSEIAPRSLESEEEAG